MENLIPMYTESNAKKRLRIEDPQPEAKKLKVLEELQPEPFTPNLRISATNEESMPNLRISAFPEKPPLYPPERKAPEIILRKPLPPHRLDEYRNPVDELGNKLFYCDDTNPIIPVRVKRALQHVGNDCAYIKNYKGTNVFTIVKTDNSEFVFQGGRKTRKQRKSYNKKTTRKQRGTLKLKQKKSYKKKKTTTKRK
jgi:hypothetical protein